MAAKGQRPRARSAPGEPAPSGAPFDLNQSAHTQAAPPMIPIPDGVLSPGGASAAVSMSVPHRMGPHTSLTALPESPPFVDAPWRNGAQPAFAPSPRASAQQPDALEPSTASASQSFRSDGACTADFSRRRSGDTASHVLGEHHQQPPPAKVGSDLPADLLRMYVLRGSIGDGSFAKVRKAIHVLSDTPVAVKMIRKKKLQDSDLRNMHREAAVWALTSHPNIANLYQVIENEHWFCFVAELCPSGELFDRIIVSKRLSEGEAREYLRQILAALAHCHALGFAHRDLKPNLNLKLVDFGLAGVFAAPALTACEKANIEQGAASKSGSGPGSGRDSLLATRCGSEYYAAPELIAGELYDGVAADTWSIGVLLYTMVCGSLPFFHDNIQRLYDQIFEGEYAIPGFLSLECEDVINACLQLDPTRRASIDFLLAMPWLQCQDDSPVAGQGPGAQSKQSQQARPRSGAALPGAAQGDSVLCMDADSAAACAEAEAEGVPSECPPHDAEVLDALGDHYGLTPIQLEQALQLGVYGTLHADYTLLVQARARLGTLPSLLRGVSGQGARKSVRRSASTGSDLSSSAPSLGWALGNALLDPELESLRREFVTVHADLGSPLSGSMGSLLDDADLDDLLALGAAQPQQGESAQSLGDGQSGPAAASESSNADPLAARDSGLAPTGTCSEPPSVPPARGAGRRRSISDVASRVLRMPGSAIASLRRLFSRTASHDAVGPRSVRGVFGTGTTSSLPPGEVRSRLLSALQGRPGAQMELHGFRMRIDYTSLGKQLKIDAEVCVVAGTALTGIRFKRLRGEAWAYQQECSALIELLQL